MACGVWLSGREHVTGSGTTWHMASSWSC